MIEHGDLISKLQSIFSRPPSVESIEQLKLLSNDFDFSGKPAIKEVELLANACRKLEWRAPVKEAGTLSTVLYEFTPENVHKEENEQLVFQALRFFCNAIADMDENRESVLPAMELIWEMTSKESLRLASLSTIVNLCRDYQPAQQRAIVNIGLLDGKLSNVMNISSRVEFQICLDIMSILVPVDIQLEKDISEQLIYRACMETMRAPSIRFSQDDFISCMETLLPILEEEKVMQLLGKENMRELTIAIFEACSFRLSGRIKELNASKKAISGDAEMKKAIAIQKLQIDAEKHSEEAKSTENEDEDINAEDEEGEDLDEDEIPQLTALLERSIVFCSSAVAFWILDVDDLTSDEQFKLLVTWLATSWKKDYINHPITGAPSPESRFGALMLGNMITSDKLAEALARYNDGEIVNAAVDIAKEVKEAALKDAASGLLCNLAVAKGNKRLIKEQGGFDAVEALLAIGSINDFGKKDADLMLILAGVKLLRRLVRDSIENSQDFLNTEVQRDSLFDKFILVIQAASPSSSISTSQILPKLQTEIGRLIIDLLRTLNSSTINSSPSSNAVSMSHLTLRPLLCIRPIPSLLLLLTNHPDPSLRSQAFMGLALFTKYDFAAVELWETVQSEASPNSPVLKLLTSKSDDDIKNILEGPGESVGESSFESKQDKQNVGVMIGYLLDSPGIKIDDDRKKFLRGLMAKLAM